MARRRLAVEPAVENPGRVEVSVEYEEAEDVAVRTPGVSFARAHRTLASSTLGSIVHLHPDLLTPTAPHLTVAVLSAAPTFAPCP